MWPTWPTSNLPRLMSAKPRLLLPDTMVIVAAMRLQRWEPLCSAFESVVPDIIADETEFFDDKNQRRIYVVVEPAPTAGLHRFSVVQAAVGSAAPDTVQGGEFTLWQAPAAEFLRTRDLLHPELSGRVHEGEQEAVTYLRLADHPHTIRFVTADSGAIQAVVAFGLGDCPVSLDAVLKSCGQQVALDDEFCDEHVRACVRLGGQRVATGRALAAAPVTAPRKKRP